LDYLDYKVVGGARCADADSEIELPFRPEIDVDGGKKLLLLIAQRIETA